MFQPSAPGARARSSFGLAIVALLMLSASAAFAQSENTPPASPIVPTRTLGDQVLQISVGPIIPLFFQSLTGTPAVLPTGLTLGGTGSLQWNAYVSKNIRVGVQIGGMFALSRRGNTLLMVPIEARGAYIFSVYPFEFPVTLGLGMNIVKYVDEVWIDPILKIGSGVFWQFDVTWSFGLNLNYWWVPHISSLADTRFGNFLEISLSALYNF
jgi:hypothetical protein